MVMLKAWWRFPVNLFPTLHDSDAYVIGLVGLALDTGENAVQ
jgi:hypothetical protein